MTSSHAITANVMPAAPRKVVRCLNDWLGAALAGWAAEDDDFNLFDDLAGAIDRARADWRGPAASWAEGLLRRFASSQRAGWQLTWASAFAGNRECFRRWLGPRLVLWPVAARGAVLRGILSSRLTRSLDARPDWFRVLRAVVAATPPEEFLVVMPHAAGANFVRRAAELSGKRTIRIDCRDGQQPWSRWLLQGLRHASRPPNFHATQIYLSPRLSGPLPMCVESEFSDIPLHDRTLVACCNTLYALDVRQHGYVHRLLRARLACQRPATPSIRLAISPGTRCAVQSELLKAGAVGWAVYSRPRAISAPECPARVPHTAPAPSHRLREGHYLTHCTRRRWGPWPEQTEREFQDDLILQRPGADHSAFAALRRIVRTRRLVASSDAVRGDARVVSFTAVPLEELRALRVFRPHRGRWDFEPYGVSIEMGQLSRQGARPVSYVDEVPANEPGTSVFQQKARSTTKRGGRLDWTVEREWRYEGDVDLARIPRHAIYLFVPTAVEARELQIESPWPVLVLPPDDPCEPNPGRA